VTFYDFQICGRFIGLLIGDGHGRIMSYIIIIIIIIIVICLLIALGTWFPKAEKLSNVLTIFFIIIINLLF